MKKILIHASILALLATAGSISNVNIGNAASISNPDCRKGLRTAQSGTGHQAFAMTPGGAHCGWTIHGHSTQSKANRAAMDICKRYAAGSRCDVVWPN